MHEQSKWPCGDSEVAAKIRMFDWSYTPLGEIRSWPQNLRATVALILDTPLAMIVLWGPERIQIYNDSYRTIVGDPHLEALGGSTQECGPETWPFNSVAWEAAFRGEPRTVRNRNFSLPNSRIPEDAQFDLTYSALRTDDGEIGGVFITIAEVMSRYKSEAILHENEQQDAFLLEFSDALRPFAASAEIQKTAMRMLGGRLGVNRAICFEIGSDHDVLTPGPAYLSGVAEMPSPVRLSDFGQQLAAEYKRGRTFIVDDVLCYPQYATAVDALAIADIRAILGVPHIKNGNLIAIMVLHQKTSRVWTSSEIALLKEAAQRTWAAVERARAEFAMRDSEERFRLFVSNVREYAFVQTDFEGIITTWNPGAERLSGYSSVEVVGRPFALLLPEEDRHGGLIAREMAAISRGERNMDACTMQRKDGTRFWAEWVTEPVLDDKGKLRGTAKVIRDETERQRSTLLLQNSLAEKDELLKEVHHRVKNNLQVITSMMNLQASSMEDQAVPVAFQEMRNRIQSIAAIHELLYRSTSFALIPLRAYAEELLPTLIQFYGAENRVEGKVLGREDASIELERAVPFGLVLNELISNALKHGFPDQRSGRLLVEIETVDTERVLRVSNTGIGLPAGFDVTKSNTLGLRLVRLLSKQLGGTFASIIGTGPVFEIRFPASQVRSF